jgi:hypothetical protein
MSVEIAHGIKKEESNAIYTELGKFAFTFSEVESLLHVLLRKITGMKDEAARIICYRLKNKELIGVLEDLLAMSDDVLDHHKERFTRLLSQFKEINEMRNSLLHRFSLVIGELAINISSFTARKANIDDKPFLYFVSSIRDATADLERMSVELQVYVKQRITLDDHPKGLDFETYTWQYIPVRQGSLGHIRPQAPK